MRCADMVFLSGDAKPRLFYTSVAFFVFSLFLTLLSFVASFGTILTGMLAPTSVFRRWCVLQRTLFQACVDMEMLSIWNLDFTIIWLQSAAVRARLPFLLFI